MKFDSTDLHIIRCALECAAEDYAMYARDTEQTGNSRLVSQWQKQEREARALLAKIEESE